jgi:hypothetical protein
MLCNLCSYNKFWTLSLIPDPEKTKCKPQKIGMNKKIGQKISIEELGSSKHEIFTFFFPFSRHVALPGSGFENHDPVRTESPLARAKSKDPLK